MPLSMAEAGQELYIKKVGGNEDSRHFLESSWLCSWKYGQSDIRYWGEHGSYR